MSAGSHNLKEQFTSCTKRWDGCTGARCHLLAPHTQLTLVALWTLATKLSPCPSLYTAIPDQTPLLRSGKGLSRAGRLPRLASTPCVFISWQEHMWYVVCLFLMFYLSRGQQTVAVSQGQVQSLLAFEFSACVRRHSHGCEIVCTCVYAFLWRSEVSTR